MRERHITREHYEAVERGDMEPEALKRRFREHALELCPVCDGELEAYVRSKRLSGLSLTTLLALLRRIEGDLGQLETEAHAQLAELMQLPPEQRRGRVTRARRRFRNPLLAELLIERSRERVFADPSEAAALAQLAFEVAARIELSMPGGIDLAHQPMTRALAYLANAQRARGDLRAADKAITAALANVGKLHDPLAHAEILALAASLRRAQRRFDEAHRLNDRAIQLYEAAGERHLAGAEILVRSQILYEEGQLAAAIDVAQAALDHINPARDPRFAVCAEHALICYLADAGHFPEARRRFDTARPLYDRFDADTGIRLRRWWLEGRLAHGTGEPDRAERLLAEARDAFLAHGNGYDAALVSLDLALLYDEQGRLDELQELADAVVPIFRSQDVHREAAAALALFVKAASRRAAGRELIETLASYLRQARQDPTMRFEEPPVEAG